MRRNTYRALMLSFLLMMIMSFTTFAGEWVSEGEDIWTYYDEAGDSVTGWIHDEGNTYYLDKDGHKTTGWMKQKGSWYYFYEDGVMAVDTWVDNYYVNEDGKMRKTR